ncbi:hypothetical protein LQV63_31285, partial [Paenibacillus profundus]|nr:hypothetical protein [Paenibacillus profundus]
PAGAKIEIPKNAEQFYKSILDKGLKSNKVPGNVKFNPTPETNKALAEKIAKDFGGTTKTAKGDGWTVNIPITYNNKSSEVTLRVMNSSKMNDNYWRLSVKGKPTVNIKGEFSTDIKETHILIGENTYNDVARIINQLNK